jgi:hypothetical protein
MSDELSKEYHSKRIQQKDVHIKKQMRIAKAHNMQVKAGEEHRLAKLSATTCGDSNCVMCGNPRKFLNEPTIQEKKFDQTKDWLE